jgi:hypothetical protein
MVSCIDFMTIPLGQPSEVVIINHFTPARIIFAILFLDNMIYLYQTTNNNFFFENVLGSCLKGNDGICVIREKFGCTWNRNVKCI